MFARGRGAFLVHTKELTRGAIMGLRTASVHVFSDSQSFCPTANEYNYSWEINKKNSRNNSVSKFLRKTEANMGVWGEAKETERNYFHRVGIWGEDGRHRGLQFL